ncbi:hypothetical protein BOX15_Mlig018914g1 [Macrostomum lignano]|uniref:Uncharacterized protein n=1 Tax=Macrostomum lignano TaxID=282301 RepID=A0A267F6P0_9PLAT|nr:hypothetical protein BOX15_Mlig018914g1 [Macrostomum lignano]
MDSERNFAMGMDDSEHIPAGYDGKRAKKAVFRKTIDYNHSSFKYLSERLFRKDAMSRPFIEPDYLFHGELLPPLGMLDCPLNCITAKHIRTSTNKNKCPIFSVCWTPEGRRLITGAASGEFTLWNGLTFNFETILQAHESSIRCMLWSHNEDWLLTADNAGYVKYWQANMNNVKMYQAHKDPIRGCSFCPTDTKFVTCSDDATVRIWDFVRCREERVLRGHGADVRSVAWHPHKSLVISGSKDAQQPIKLWDPKSGESLTTLYVHKNTCTDVQWNRNGNWFLTASRDNLIKLFDVRNLRQDLQTFRGHKKDVMRVAWHPEYESLFASGGADGAMMFWNVGTRTDVGCVEDAHENMIWSLAWHPLGHIIVTGSNDFSTKFWSRNRPGDVIRDAPKVVPGGAVAAPVTGVVDRRDHRQQAGGHHRQQIQQHHHHRDHHHHHHQRGGGGSNFRGGRGGRAGGRGGHFHQGYRGGGGGSFRGGHGGGGGAPAAAAHHGPVQTPSNVRVGPNLRFKPGVRANDDESAIPALGDGTAQNIPGIRSSAAEADAAGGGEESGEPRQPRKRPASKAIPKSFQAAWVKARPGLPGLEGADELEDESFIPMADTPAPGPPDSGGGAGLQHHENPYAATPGPMGAYGIRRSESRRGQPPQQGGIGGSDKGEGDSYGNYGAYGDSGESYEEPPMPQQQRRGGYPFPPQPQFRGPRPPPMPPLGQKRGWDGAPMGSSGRPPWGPGPRFPGAGGGPQMRPRPPHYQQQHRGGWR